MRRGTFAHTMAITRCLVVDDDPELLQSVCDYLRRFGFDTVAAASAAQMRAALSQGGVDMLILDVMLPDGDGLAICAALRQRPETADLPVIMLTAQGDPHSRVLGLELGADDYVAKPFEPRELVARIKAVLRRRSAPAGDRGGDGTVEFAGWRFDRLKRQLVSPQQVVVPLSSAEYRLLSAFVERPRRVLTRDQLLDATRGQGVVVADRAIDLAVSRLRQKLSAAQDGEQLICTIRGEGYIFDAEVK
ncbi:response regulator [Scleromatobacter humisilvae]|uniref:Response regulator transcription factor n=1 Tax=Scleromatobacter humisilvae TaxID=2897159 RepID=A0A9X2C185_9BURK|nr:response regulator transcription factor [Scleromatobacter humisilvae]MCK9685534.1 response regulator transcription factor [Scleromatobacter humisilvae]